MSHWGREVRFPYLDEKLLSWALDAPATEKCGFGESVADGLSTIPDVQETAALEPGKKVLRCLAWKLGMKGVAREKKRAVRGSDAQFHCQEDADKMLDPVRCPHREDGESEDEGNTATVVTRRISSPEVPQPVSEHYIGPLQGM
jgi:asparagine synthetase B (glutamine-hydrolysing)